jgi:heme/copper-type cytochrome/quinol oxidase subunit 3
MNRFHKHLVPALSLSINDSVYSSVFFFLTGLHFFHLVVGLLLLSLLSWSSSFPAFGIYISLEAVINLLDMVSLAFAISFPWLAVVGFL